jgi:hypothetical protein
VCLCSKSSSVDAETVDEEKQGHALELLKGYAPRDIFNADETGLFYNALPNKALCFKGKTVMMENKSKLTLTVFLFINSGGTEKR